MLCENPYMVGVMPCGCGQCVPCRTKRKKLWVSRIMLESLKHGDSSFITLTYSDDKLPGDFVHRGEFFKAGLYPKDLQDWLKRLRFMISPRKLRYYAVGEYGDESWRPHYHAVVFGLSPLEVNTVRTSWGLGHVVVGNLTIQSAAYVAGYVTKKMGKKIGDAALDGKYPEFQRMSLCPGIGALAMEDVAKVMSSEYAQADLAIKGDVPESLTMGGKSLPLGRYLRQVLRKNLGRSSETPEKCLEKYALTMRVMFEDFIKTTETSSRGPKKLVLDMFAQQRLNLLAKNKIYQGAKTI